MTGEIAQPGISILLASRMEGNQDCRLHSCLQSLAATAADKSSFEVLVKLDDNDAKSHMLVEAMARFRGVLNIRCIVSPRGLGYADLHKAYMDLLRIASAESALFWVLSDDIELSSHGWDAILLGECSRYADGIFVLNTEVHRDYADIEEALQGPEPYPVWSRRWLALQGGFGYTCFSDGWTSLLCYHLKASHGINRRIAVKGITVHRHGSARDSAGSERWNGIRRQNHEVMLSAQAQDLLQHSALGIASTIKQLAATA